VAVLIGLHAGEERAEHDGEDQAIFQALAIVLEQRMVGPGHRGAGGEQDQRVQERKMPGIEGLDAVRRPGARHGAGAGRGPETTPEHRIAGGVDGVGRE